MYFSSRPSVGPLRGDEPVPASGWDSPRSNERTPESHNPTGRKVKGGTMDDREDEEEEEEASPSCFPREDSCDTGERGHRGQDKRFGPRIELAATAGKVCWHKTKGQNLSGAL